MLEEPHSSGTAQSSSKGAFQLSLAASGCGICFYEQGNLKILRLRILGTSMEENVTRGLATLGRHLVMGTKTILQSPVWTRWSSKRRVSHPKRKKMSGMRQAQLGERVSVHSKMQGLWRRPCYRCKACKSCYKAPHVVRKRQWERRHTSEEESQVPS